MNLVEYIRTRLRSRYAIKLFWISFLIVAVVVALGVIMGVQVSDRVTANQLQSIEANAELEANALGRWMEGEQQTIRILSGSMNALNETQTRSILNSEITDQATDLAGYHVVERASGPTSNGTTERIVASTQPALEGREIGVTNVNWGENPDETPRKFRFADRNDLLTSWVYIDDGEPLVAIATPTADGDHVLIGEYRPSVRVNDSVDVVDGTNTVVLGGISGFVIFDETSPDEFRRYKGQVNSTTVGAKILARDDPSTVLNGSAIDTNEVRGYHSVPTAGIDWVVVKETPKSAALALTNQVQTDFSLIMGVMIIGFLLLGGVIDRGPIQAIKETASQADALAHGDLDISIEQTDRNDEIGDLRRSFRNILAYINTIAEQSQALSRKEFDADVLDEEIPGVVGESMATMETDLERFISELEAERERYSTLIEQSNDGVVVIQDGEFVFSNDRFLEITGYSREALLELSFIELVAPVDRDYVLEKYRNRSDLSPEQQYEIRIETVAGERRTVEVSGARIIHDGAKATLTNVRDITARKRRERRLMVFNRVLRHNLRNSLQTVQAALDAADHSPTHASLMDSAQGQVEDLLSTANTARRIEDAFGDLTMRQLELQPLLDSLLERAETEYPGATVNLPDETATVEAAHVLRDALWEVVENACEHAEGAAIVDIEIERTDADAIIHISDDGPGIPQIERETLGSDDATELRHTSGLGLWFVYWTVQASSGDLTFAVDGGTTVSVTLPLAAEAEQGRD
jgi:PAS domain S-box-containing protein